MERNLFKDWMMIGMDEAVWLGNTFSHVGMN
jgi:hypothetical protein